MNFENLLFKCVTRLYLSEVPLMLDSFSLIEKIPQYTYMQIRTCHVLLDHTL